MSTDLVLHSADEAFVLADRISRSNLVPSAYRNKPTETAIAMMYGAEMGMPPMSSLQRITVINGKPSMDAQGMVALIRKRGHSISGEVSVDGAVVTGKRGDNGDEMMVTWGPDDAARAGLRSDTYNKFPSDMYWARAVSQLGRRLFADVLLGVSYVPEEAEAIPTNGNGHGNGRAAYTAPEPPAAPSLPPERTLRPPPGQPAADAMGEIIDAEVVDEAPGAAEAPSASTPATTKQINAIRKLLNAAGVRDETASCERVSGIIGRTMTTLAEMTEPEADAAAGELAS